jgi:hypothetical protein
MFQYDRLKTEHAHAWRLWRDTADEVERLEFAAKAEFTPDEARDRQNNQFLERSVMLNNLKQRYQFHLEDLRRDIRQAESQQLTDTFAGVVDVFLSVDELKSNSPAIGAVTFDGTRDVQGKPFVRLKSGDRTWSLDPARIVAVRATPAAGKSK